MDVTPTVTAEKQLQQAHEQLALEKIRTDALLKRQHELIDVLGKVSNAGKDMASDSAAGRMLEAVKRSMIHEGRLGSLGRGGAGVGADGKEVRELIEMLELIGEGSVSASSGII